MSLPSTPRLLPLLALSHDPAQMLHGESFLAAQAPPSSFQNLPVSSCRPRPRRRLRPRPPYPRPSLLTDSTLSLLRRPSSLRNLFLLSR
eukprot:748479-Hanusia_phi.AAC.1